MTPLEMSPLFRLAIASGRPETVRSHLERGADANACDSTGASALLLAAARGRQEICEILLEHGADPSVSDSTGRTIDDYARQWDFDLKLADVLKPESEPNRTEESAVSGLVVVEVPLPPVQDDPLFLPEPPLEPHASSTSPEPSSHQTEVLIDAVAAALGLLRSAAMDEPDGQHNLNGWEAEPHFHETAQDVMRVAAAEVAHETFSRPSASVDATDWSFVAARLPRAVAVELPEFPPSLRALLVKALHDGRLTTSRLRKCLRTVRNGDKYVVPLRFLLSDLGVTFESSRFEDVLNEEAPAHRIDDDEGDGLADAAELLESMLSDDPEPVYLASVRSLREDALGLQPILWARAEELRRRLAHLFASMPDGLHYLESAGALFSFDRDEAAIEMSESDEDQPEEGEEDEVVTAVADADQSVVADHLSSRFAGLSRADIVERLSDMRLSPNVLEDAARLARASGVDAAEDAVAAADELRMRLNRLVETNLGLVAWIAGRYRNKGMEPLDLIQEGNIGLMKAVYRFDPGRGATLGTYATWWIRQSMTRAMADLCRTIRIPVHLQERARRLERVRPELQIDLGRPATDLEVADEMEISLDAVIRLQKNVANLVPASGDNVDRLSSSMISNLADDHPNQENEMWEGKVRQEITDLLLELTPREERVVRLRFGMGRADELTLEEVGERFEVTRERIRQIEAKAIRRLSHPGRCKRLRGVLDVQ